MSSRDATDAALIARIRAGHSDAMTNLYDRYAQIVYSVALRVLGDTGAAEDVTQDIFLQLWRSPQSFDSSRGSLGAWLAVIARHRAIDTLRKRKASADVNDVTIPFDAKLESEVDRSIFAAKVRAAMASLAPEQRKAMEMAFFEGLTHTEIAAKTGDPLGTVKTRIRSGLAALRKGLQKTDS